MDSVGGGFSRVRGAVLCTVALGAGVVCLSGAKYSAATGTASCRVSREFGFRGSQHLFAVALDGPGSVLAVGARRAGRSEHSLVERLSHNRWARIQTPDIGLLGDVSATSRRNVWAVGARKALHWDGRRWKQVSLPNASGLRGFAVSHISATTQGLWVHGARFVWHWNGKRWRTWATKGLTNYGGISALSDHDVWVGGDDAYVGEKGELHTRPLLLHWDGRRWQHMQIPADPELEILAIDARGVDQVWITGYRADQDDRWTGVVEEWDGSTWHDLDQPKIVAPYGVAGQVSYTTISAVDAQSAWVGGDAGDVPLTILASARESIMPPEPSPLSAVVYDIDAVDAKTAWAVAFDSKSSLIERVACDQ